MGGSSAITVLLSILRYKVIAIELGPEGIGILGFLLTGLTLATTLFSVGIGQTGVRYIAVANEEGSDALARMRGALTVTAHLLAAASLLTAVLFRAPLAVLFSADPSWMFWFGIGVWASVVSTGQLAIVNGLRRISALARAHIVGAVLGTVVTVPAVLLAEEAGLVAAVVAAPIATWLAALWVTRGIPFRWPEGVHTFVRHIRPVLSLGFALSTSILLTSATQLLVRIDIETVLGLEAAGFFQASWSISKVYLGFILTALAAEYFPRISALAAHPDRLNHAVSEQIAFVVPLAGAAILSMIVLTQWIIFLMYSSEFGAATSILRWQLSGDILKVGAWALGYLLLAREARWAYFGAELLWNASYLLSIHLLLPRFGLEVTGVAYLTSYVAYFLTVLALARRASAFTPHWRALVPTLALFTAAVSVTLLLEVMPEPAWIAASSLAGIAILYCLFSVIRRVLAPPAPSAQQELS